MSDVADFTHIPAVSKPQAVSVALPVPVPFETPILIGDCASPLCGETVLSLLWKRLDVMPEDDG